MFERDLAVQSAIDFEGKPLSNENLAKIPSSGCDYVATYNEWLAIGQAQGMFHAQEDKVCTGSVPDEYFDLPDEARRVFMRRVCEKLQKKLTHSIPQEMRTTGSTVLLLFTNGDVVDIGYLGDSEVFLIVEESGKPRQCHFLNAFQHNSMNPVEKERIERAGGVIKPGKDGWPRVQGQLIPTRGIGNNDINGLHDNNKIIDREPTCVIEPIDHEGNKTIHLIAATDGLTAKARSKAHDDYIKEKLGALNGKPAKQQLLDLLKEVKKDGTADDVTAALLKISKGMKPVFLAEFDSHFGPVVAAKAIEEITTILNDELPDLVNYYKDDHTTQGSNSSQEATPSLPLGEDCPAKPVATTPKPAAAGADPARDNISQKALARHNAVVFSLGKKRTEPEEDSEEEDSKLKREKFGKGSPPR